MTHQPRTNVPAYLGFWIRDSSRWLRYQWRKLRGATATKIHGIRLPVPADFPPGRRHSMLSERLERRAVLAILTRLDAEDRVMEFGGGLGMLSSVCASRIGSDRVVSYEPNPAQIPFIRRVHELNGIRPELVEAAIGAADGRATFCVRDDIVSSSLRDGGTERTRDDGTRPVEVRVLGVNGQIEVFRPTFLLVDIEGAEREVFAVADLDGVRKIMIELHPEVLGDDGVREVLESIERAGFAPVRWLSSNRKRYFERRPPASAARAS